MKKEEMPLSVDVEPLSENQSKTAPAGSVLKKVSGKRDYAGLISGVLLFIVILCALALFGVWKFKQYQIKVAEEMARAVLFEIENPFFKDLYGVENSEYAFSAGLAKGGDKAVQSQKKAVEDLGIPLEVENRSTGIRFRLIPAGSFIMGSSLGEPGRDADEKQHEVAIDEPFYCSKYEITQRQWRQIMGSKKAGFSEAGKSAPVENVTWTDARRFINALSKKSGVTNITYRLLTEAQWEYACRAGTYTPLYSGDISIKGHNNAPEVDDIGWYAGNSAVEYEGAYDSSAWPETQFPHTKAGTHPVGRKIPNAFGLYDMPGNVWEWCRDWYDEYPASFTNNPCGPESGHYKVIRGGAWNSPAHKCRSADRDRALPKFSDPGVGFRIMRVIRFDPYPAVVTTNSSQEVELDEN